MSPSPQREYPDHPQVGVGALVIREGRVLLVRRGRPPANDVWAIPGGRLELGETLQQAAEREVFEETGTIIRAGQPFYTFESIVRDEQGRVRFHYVIVDLLAEYVSGEVHPGDDAQDAAWLSLAELEELPMHPATLEVVRRALAPQANRRSQSSPRPMALDHSP